MARMYFYVQAVMNAMDRDAISGWGAVVHIIEKDKVCVLQQRLNAIEYVSANQISLSF